MRIEVSFLNRMMRERAPALYFTTLTLSQSQRDGVHALYAFFRISRDLIDRVATKNEATSAAARFLRLLENASSDRHAVAQPIVDQTIDDSPDLGLAWEAWCALEEDFSVPRAYAIEFARGLQLEAEGVRPTTMEDLLRFSYQTGGVFGLILLHILKLDAKMQQAAVDAASATRLTTLSRDIYRHFTLGRIFVPLSWLSMSDTRVFSTNWSESAARRFESVARVMYASSRESFTGLPWKTRLALAAALVVHREARSRWWRQLDRVADELIRQAARGVRETYRHYGTPYAAPTAAPPVRDFATVLRNQNLLLSRDLTSTQSSAHTADKPSTYR